MRPLPQRHRRRHIRETSNQNLRAENGILRCPKQESGSGHIVKNMPKHSGITLAMALSTLLAIPAPAADKPAFPLPGRDLVGTWKVESIEIPHLPADRSVTSLSGWGEALEITSGLLPVGQIVEFRAGDGEGSVLAGDSANEPAAGENLEMRLLEPIQPGVCINRAWKFHCKPGPDDTFVPGDQAISRTMLVQPHFVPRFKERKQYWDDLAPDGYDLVFEDSAPRSVYVYLPLHDRNKLYFPLVIFDAVLAKDKGFDGMVVLKRIADRPAGQP